VKYNPNIVGILIINPDNPTGMVYPRWVMERMVEIAREFDLFLVSDEIYLNITYNGAEAVPLAKVIGDVPGIALKGISKEFPWPGSRCGWAEYYNRKADKEFDRLCQTLDDAKMVEVCSTKLPQLAIPKIMQDQRYQQYRKEANQKIGERAKLVASFLKDLPCLTFNETYGAFYNTIIFNKGYLKDGQSLSVENPKAKALVEEWVAQAGLKNDQRFVYYLLAAKGVCVVPISSFCSELEGFRLTLLEEKPEVLKDTFQKIREAVIEYVGLSEPSERPGRNNGTGLKNP